MGRGKRKTRRQSSKSWLERFAAPDRAAEHHGEPCDGAADPSFVVCPGELIDR